MMSTTETCLVCNGQVPLGMAHNALICTPVDATVTTTSNNPDTYFATKIEPLRLPEVTWSMSLGDLSINHVKPINVWQRFWIRFMGWKVEVYKEND